MLCQELSPTIDKTIVRVVDRPRFARGGEAGHNRCFVMNYDVIMSAPAMPGSRPRCRGGADGLRARFDAHTEPRPHRPDVVQPGHRRDRQGPAGREIDALGGEMGVAIEETGIQFRFLNTRKGPGGACASAQADKAAYRSTQKRVLERHRDTSRRVHGERRAVGSSSRTARCAASMPRSARCSRRPT